MRGDYRDGRSVKSHSVRSPLFYVGGNRFFGGLLYIDTKSLYASMMEACRKIDHRITRDTTGKIMECDNGRS